MLSRIGVTILIAVLLFGVQAAVVAASQLLPPFAPVNMSV